MYAYRAPSAKRKRSSSDSGDPVMRKILVYTLAFVVPVLFIGTIVTYRSVAGWITVEQPETRLQELPAPPVYDPDKPTAVVLVSNQGAESTDVLAPYAILASSGALNVYTVAPKRQVSPIQFGVNVLPHYSFEGLDQELGRSPDLILIPAIPDPEDKAIVSWVQRHAKPSTLLVSVCEGVRVLAASGLLHNRKASTHFLSMGELESDYPSTKWTRGVRWVEDGNFITSAGVTASIDATLHALRRVAGLQVALETAEKLNYQMELHPRVVDTFDFKMTDFLSLFMTAGFLWDKTNSGVLLFDGIDEVELGSVLDLYPRVFDGMWGAVAPVRRVYRSRNALDLVPLWTFEEAPGLDRVLITGEKRAADLTGSINHWVESNGMSLERPHSSRREIATDTPVFAYDLVLQDIASQRSKAVARAVAKWVEYPVVHIQLSGSNWPYQLLLVAMGVGLAGVALGRWGILRGQK